MPELFGEDIAGIIATEMGEGLLPAVLRNYSPGTRTPGGLTAGTNPTLTGTASSARGFIDDYSDRDYGGDSIVQVGDRKVTLLGGTLDGLVPATGSQIDIEGVTLVVVGPVKRDPAGATYECQCRIP